MAIQKTIIQPTGVEVKYWRIIQTIRHYDRNEIVIDVAGYISETDRKSGKNPVTSIQIIRPISEVPETRDDVYPIVKSSKLDEEGNETNPLFGAEDIL